jgi:hypothetical protein
MIRRAGVTQGCEVQAGAGEEPAQEGGPVLHPLEPGLDQRGQLGEVALGEIGQGSFQVRPDQLQNVTNVIIKPGSKTSPANSKGSPADGQ